MTGSKDEEKRQIFERFLPGKLSHDEIDTLLHFARVESYPAGKEIYAKGSLGRSMMAVLRGTAKMTSVSRDLDAMPETTVFVGPTVRISLPVGQRQERLTAWKQAARHPAIRDGLAAAGERGGGKSAPRTGSG